MVSKVSASVPFSYLDKLQGVSGGGLPKKTPPAPSYAAPVKTAVKPTETKLDTNNSLAKRLGLSNEILNILQGKAETSKKSEQAAGIAELFGSSGNKASAGELIAKIYSNLLTSSTTSATLQIAAQNAAAKQADAAREINPLDKILADYSKALNSGNEFLKPTVKISG